MYTNTSNNACRQIIVNRSNLQITVQRPVFANAQ